MFSTLYICFYALGIRFYQFHHYAFRGKIKSNFKLTAVCGIDDGAPSMSEFLYSGSVQGCGVTSGDQQDQFPLTAASQGHGLNSSEDS